MSIEYIIQKTAKILTRFWLYLENQHNVNMTFTKGSWLFRPSLHSIISALKRCKTKLTILKLVSQKRILDGAYFDNSAILLSAEPARNHSSCDSFMVWFSWISSWLPSLCFSTVFTGFRVKERERYVDQFVPHGNLSSASLPSLLLFEIKHKHYLSMNEKSTNVQSKMGNNCHKSELSNHSIIHVST